MHPNAIARSYNTRLQKGPLAYALKLLKEMLVPELRRLAGSVSRVATTDADDDLGRIMDRVREAHLAIYNREKYEALVKRVGPDLAAFQAEQFNRQLRSVVAVDVVGNEPWLAGAIKDFTRENVALIKSVPTSFLDDLEKKLAGDLADGARFEALATTLEDRFGVAQGRAKLIARDQAGKFFGDLNRVRQSDLGITKGIWRTSEDNRVREEHAARDGQSFDWNEGIDGETPGEPVLCRCYGEPDLESLANEN